MSILFLIGLFQLDLQELFLVSETLIFCIHCLSWVLFKVLKFIMPLGASAP